MDALDYIGDIRRAEARLQRAEVGDKQDAALALANIQDGRERLRDLGWRFTSANEITRADPVADVAADVLNAMKDQECKSMTNLTCGDLDDQMATAREVAVALGYETPDDEELRQIMSRPMPGQEPAKSAAATSSNDDTVILKDFEGKTLKLEAAAFAKLVKGRSNWHSWSDFGIGELVAEAKKLGDEATAKSLATFKASMKGVAVVFGPEGWTPSTQAVKKVAAAKSEEPAQAGDEELAAAEELAAVTADIEAYFSRGDDK